MTLIGSEFPEPPNGHSDVHDMPLRSCCRVVQRDRTMLLTIHPVRGTNRLNTSTRMLSPFDVFNEEIEMLNGKFPIQHFLNRSGS